MAKSSGSGLFGGDQSIESRLDPLLKYHVDMILSYAERNPIEELHARYVGDPVFELFGFTDMSFTRKRWEAGFANSCATNLGRFTDKATKVIFGVASGLDAAKLLKTVEISANDAVETEEVDGVLLLDEVDVKMRARLQTVTDRLKTQHSADANARGLGFEFRGRYGKNDDTLLQKDEHMAAAIRGLGAIPVLGMFSTANAATAMARLRRSWVIVAGHETTDLLAELTGFDLIAYLKSRAEMLAPIKGVLLEAKKD